MENINALQKIIEKISLLDFSKDIVVHVRSCLDEIKINPKFISTMQRFESSTRFPEETGGFYSEELVVPLIELNGWSVMLVRHEKDLDTKFIHALPMPTIISLLGTENTGVINTYSYDERIDYDLSETKNSNLIRRDDIALSENDFWISDGKGKAYKIDSYTPNSIFIRISGPPHAPFTHTFDPQNLNYLYSGLSNSLVTALDIISYVSLKFSSDHLNYEMSEDETSNIINLYDKVIDDSRSAPTSKWRIIEAMYTLAPEKTLSILSSLSHVDGPLKQVAQQTLESQHDVH